MVPDVPPPVFRRIAWPSWAASRCRYRTGRNWRERTGCVEVHTTFTNRIMYCWQNCCITFWFIHDLWSIILCSLYIDLLIYFLLNFSLFCSSTHFFHDTFLYSISKYFPFFLLGAKVADYYLHKVKSAYFIIPALFTFPSALFMALAGTYSFTHRAVTTILWSIFRIHNLFVFWLLYYFIAFVPLFPFFLLILFSFSLHFFLFSILFLFFEVVNIFFPQST